MVGYVPRQRKHKVLARQKASETAQHEDTNQETLLPSDQKTALAERRARLKEELKQEGTKMSGKKAKRLEKYIDSKLRGDENRELVAKLAARKIDTSLFSSSRSFGQGHETKKQAMSRALREQRAGLDASESSDLLLEARAAPDESEDDMMEETAASPRVSSEALAAPVVKESGASQGLGLKRPLEVDDDGRPVIKKRRKRGGVKSKVSREPALLTPESESEGSEDNEEEWGGFSEDEKGNEEAQTDLLLQETAARQSGEDGQGQSSDEADDATSSEDGSEDDSEEEETDGKVRSSGFKVWAMAQRNQALGHHPVASSALLDVPKPQNFVPRQPEQDALPRELEQTQNGERKAYSVTVTRSAEIQEARLKLPVVGEEQRLMEAIHNNDIVVICGATGSGKTTQVPQFLFEAGYGSPDSPTPGMVGVTQPRRVAAVSMSARVASELGDHSKAVAYQIRFEGNVAETTAVKFMTDGVLLREAAKDISLQKYSAIIIDEAHERSVNTDILVGMLSRVVKLRLEMAQTDKTISPLKLIIMSATLRVDDMTKNPRLFPSPPPVMDVQGRQHPVTVHFSRRTTPNYVEEAFKKISRGHRKLPPGGFLIFLTGRNEIIELSKKLKDALGGLRTADGPKVQLPSSQVPMEAEDIEFGDVDDYGDDYVDGLPSDDDDEDADAEFQVEEEQEAAPLKVQILPLYSLLPTREQLRVFDPVPEGTRQIILATNVAETSLTIPGTRFVFDCGRSKERKYDTFSGVQSYEVGWISKASASQRSGRAGRTGPGHCYRLYSSAVYERDFREFADPEMLRMPIEGVVLQLKAMNLSRVHNFPFPTPPDHASLTKAEKLLTYLAAITPEGNVTEVGTTMSIFPLSPRFARILLVGHLHGCVHYTIAMVAAMSAAEIFLPENQVIPAIATDGDDSYRSHADMLAETRQADARKQFNKVHGDFCVMDGMSDAIKLLKVVGEFAHHPTEAWCTSHFVRYKVLREIQQLRQQIVHLLRINIPTFKSLSFLDKLPQPTEKQINAMKQMAAVGFIDQVAIRADLAPIPPEQTRRPGRAIDVPYVPLFPLHGDDTCVYIHPTSPLAHLSVQECPQYIVYAQLQRATQGIDETRRPKVRMHALTDVTGGQLARLAKGTPLMSYGKPIKESNLVLLAGGVQKRDCYLIPYLRAPDNSGSQGWPLPAMHVKQRKEPGKGWVTDY